MNKKVMIVLEVADQLRLRELVAMWAYSQVGQSLEVTHAVSKIAVGEITVLDFISAEVVEEPPSQRRVTKQEMQDRLSISGNR